MQTNINISSMSVPTTLSMNNLNLIPPSSDKISADMISPVQVKVTESINNINTPTSIKLEGPSFLTHSNLTHSNAIKRPTSSIAKIQKNIVNSKMLNAKYAKSAVVFAYSLNDIIKSHLPDKKFRNDNEKIEVYFVQKLIGKVQLNFTQLVLTLIYCNRYLRNCRKYKLPMPGSPGSVFPIMSHMIIPCLILAEIYIDDCPRNCIWWANKCSGGVTVKNIVCWKRDVFITMKYWLYVEPTNNIQTGHVK